MTSEKLKINKHIELINKLEDFVLKKIKYPCGDPRGYLEYFKSLEINISRDHSEYSYEITEMDKQNIYAFHSLGGYKETEQQKKYRETAIQQIIASDDPNDTVEIPLNDRLPRYYDDILNDIRQFHSYIESQQPINLKQVEKLRKKAFYTYAMHNDCKYLTSIPKDIYKIFEKIHNGRQQRSYIDVIKRGFLEYAEKELFDQDKVNKITTFNKDYIIENLEENSFKSVKNQIIIQLKVKIYKLHILVKNLDISSKAILTSDNPFQNFGSIPVFSNKKYFKDNIRKHKKRITEYVNDLNEIRKLEKPLDKKSIRNKFTGDSNTWLKQHKVEGKSLYSRIEEIAENNKKKSYLKT